MRLETCIHTIHGFVDVCLCSGYQKFTVLSASATECLLRLLVLAPNLSPDYLQGCHRGRLPYTVNQLLTGSLPKTPQSQDNSSERTEIACWTGAAKREGYAIPFSSQVRYLYRLFHFIIGDTQNVKMLLQDVGLQLRVDDSLLSIPRAILVTMVAQLQMRSRTILNQTRRFARPANLLQTPPSRAKKFLPHLQCPSKHFLLGTSN